MEQTFEVKLEIKTQKCAGPKQALAQVKRALFKYSDRNLGSLEVTASSIKDTTPQPPVCKIGLGSKFTKKNWENVDELFMIAACGWGGRYVLVRISDGCWSISANGMEGLVKEIQGAKNFTLTATVVEKSSTGTYDWAGKVALSGN